MALVCSRRRKRAFIRVVDWAQRTRRTSPRPREFRRTNRRPPCDVLPKIHEPSAHDEEEVFGRSNNILQLLPDLVSVYTDKLQAHVTLARRFASSGRGIDTAIRIGSAKRGLGAEAPHNVGDEVLPRGTFSGAVDGPA